MKRMFVFSSRGAFVLFCIMIFGLVISTFSTAVFWKLKNEVLEQELQTIDLVVSHFVYSLRTTELTSIMMLVTDLGGIYLVFFGAAIIVFLTLRKHVREAVLFMFILAMGLMLNMILKQYSQRPRPELDRLIVETDFSFPSGHAMNSLVFYTTVSYLVFHFTRNGPLTVVAFSLSALLVGLIGLSRVYLGVHYPSDILAGWAAGSSWFVTVILIQKTMIFFRLFHERRAL